MLAEKLIKHGFDCFPRVSQLLKQDSHKFALTDADKSLRLTDFELIEENRTQVFLSTSGEFDVLHENDTNYQDQEEGVLQNVVKPQFAGDILFGLDSDKDSSIAFSSDCKGEMRAKLVDFVNRNNLAMRVRNLEVTDEFLIVTDTNDAM